MSGPERCSVCESEGDTRREVQSAQIQRRGSSILQFEKFIFVSINQPDCGRMIHDFCDEQLAEILRRIEKIFDDRAPCRSRQHSRPDLHRAIDRDRTRIGLRSTRNSAADRSRIRTVGREINCAACIGVGQLQIEARRHFTAELTERRGAVRREQIIDSQLCKQYARARRNPGVHHEIDCIGPFGFAVRRLMGSDLHSLAHEPRGARRRRERSAAETVFLHMIAETDPVFLVAHHFLVHPLWVRIGKVAFI